MDLPSSLLRMKPEHIILLLFLEYREREIREDVLCQTLEVTVPWGNRSQGKNTPVIYIIHLLFQVLYISVINIKEGSNLACVPFQGDIKKAVHFSSVKRILIFILNVKLNI